MSLRLRSLLRADGTLELALHDEPMPTPKDDEVVVRIEAAPINPSDLGVLLSRADVTTVRAGGSADRPVVTLDVPAAQLPDLAARFDKPLAVGNEGAGTVVAAGVAPAAQALLGKRVGVYGGGTYAEHSVFPAALCLPLPDGVTAAQGASSFVNPMSVLAMLETARAEGHAAIVHTAAASNLGQMLVKACAKDGVPLVNVVRRAEQAAQLRALGAEHVCDSSAATFDDDLVKAIGATQATLAFDAIGGGNTANRILRAMERALLQGGTRPGPYGTTVHKQVYVYGMLDRGPTELDRSYGLSWGVGGWLVSNALAKAGLETAARLRARVASELTTTFASHYTAEVSLRGMLALENLERYAKQATGEKFLVSPAKA